jgi:hypothetical protein
MDSESGSAQNLLRDPSVQVKGRSILNTRRLRQILSFNSRRKVTAHPLKQQQPDDLQIVLCC